MEYQIEQRQDIDQFRPLPLEPPPLPPRPLPLDPPLPPRPPPRPPPNPPSALSIPLISRFDNVNVAPFIFPIPGPATPLVLFFPPAPAVPFCAAVNQLALFLSTFSNTTPVSSASCRRFVSRSTAFLSIPFRFDIGMFFSLRAGSLAPSVIACRSSALCRFRPVRTVRSANDDDDVAVVVAATDVFDASDCSDKRLDSRRSRWSAASLTMLSASSSSPSAPDFFEV